MSNLILLTVYVVSGVSIMWNLQRIRQIRATRETEAKNRHLQAEIERYRQEGDGR